MPAANVIELRRLLAEKFPGLRTQTEQLAARPRTFWPTGLPQLDRPLQGGLPSGALTEIVAGQRGVGSALLMRWLLQRAAEEGRLIALVDGLDSFDVTQLDEQCLPRLLWVRCHSADEALKAADLLLRDGNFSLILLDLVSNPASQLRKISPTTWYRLQRIVEQTPAVCAVLTPSPMAAPAQARITLNSQFSLKVLDVEHDELRLRLKLQVSHSQRSTETAQEQKLA